MKKWILISLAAGAMFADGERGIRPRPDAADYPNHQNGAAATVGVAMLTPEQARKQFAADLNKLGYLVVEVGVYPDSSKNVEIAARDFVLRVTPEGTTSRPVSASAIAAQLHKHEPAASSTTVPASPVHVSTGANIGYESGGGPYGRGGGVYGGGGVGVGVGGPNTDPRVPPSRPPAASGKDADSLSVQVDLENQALPEGKIDSPVAGYLYFVKPVMRKKSSLDLTWYGPGEQVRVPLSAK
ncbi:MAG TPA: hypothetical protein VKX45_00225 [Bryobacteraceae bacterium]|jgi:hypothetical protein|nr:hypothetical protein [Bryobacteraceae bacterium]